MCDQVQPIAGDHDSRRSKNIFLYLLNIQHKLNTLYFIFSQFPLVFDQMIVALEGLPYQLLALGMHDKLLNTNILTIVSH